ncbi:hypothetical protein SLE2022_080780 [Rubroshorea leprosula]
MWDIMRRREVIWKQKSRSNWVPVGDANTRFFHRVANGRKAQNHITGLLRDGCWVEEPEQVKKEVYNYFSKLFQGETWNRPKPCGVSFKQISAEEKQWIKNKVNGCAFSFNEWKVNPVACALSMRSHKQAMKLFHKQQKEGYTAERSAS